MKALRLYTHTHTHTHTGILLNKKKIERSKGITIVSLVITIIILLILATISIQALTNTGLFESANKAKLETKRSQIKEWLSLNLMEAQTTNYNKTASEILEEARQKADSSEDLKRLGKKVNVDGELSTEEDGQTVPPYFDVIVDNDMYKVSMEEQEFIGEVGKIIPSLDFSATTTSKSITLKIITKRNQGGTVECYIKGADDSNYGTAQTATDNQYTFDNLDQGKKYSVKVVVTSGNGQKAEKEKEYTTGNIKQLTTSDIIFTYTVDGKAIDKSTWTNGTVKVSARMNPEIDITGLKIQTSKDGKNYEDTDTQTFTENGTMYVILTDGKNYGGSAGGAVTNIDKTKPTIGNVQGSNTTSNIGTILVSNIEDEGGSGINAYYISMNNTKPTTISENWKSLSGDSFAYNVTSNGTYYIWVKDLAGNISENKNCTISGIVAKVDITNCNGTTIVAGNSGKVTVSYTGTPKSITYTSLNSEIATVNSNTGEVRGIATGTAKIKVELINYDGTSISGTCDVIVQTAVASIENTYYASLGDAINSTSSATVNLLIDTSENIVISEGKSITLNLNGKTLSGNDNTKEIVKNEGTLNIAGNGTIEADKTQGIYNLSIATIENGTITSNGSFTVHNKGTLSMKGGKIEHKDYDFGTAFMNQGGGFYMTAGQIISNGFGLVTRNGGLSHILGNNTLIKSTSQNAIVADTIEGKEGASVLCVNANIDGSIRIDDNEKLYLIDCNMENIEMLSDNIVEVYTNEEGYDIYLYDNNTKYTKVQFPTWTVNKDQDDIIWYNAISETRNNHKVWHYHVKKSEHNNEIGGYTTHIYVTDINNNYYFYGGFGIDIK